MSPPEVFTPYEVFDRKVVKAILGGASLETVVPRPITAEQPLPVGMTSMARTALAAVRAQWGSHPRVFVSATCVPQGVRTAMGVHVPVPADLSSRVWLIFVDLHPDAEWSHDCRYVFVDHAGRVSRPHHETYPPTQREGLQLVDVSGWP